MFHTHILIHIIYTWVAQDASYWKLNARFIKTLYMNHTSDTCPKLTYWAFYDYAISAVGETKAVVLQQNSAV